MALHILLVKILRMKIRISYWSIANKMSYDKCDIDSYACARSQSVSNTVATRHN